MDSFDRLVLAVIAALIVAIGAVLAAGDHVGVPILDHIPAGGDSPAVTAPIRITFGERMVTASAEAHFAISPAAGGRFTWERNTLIFTPAAPLAPEETYTVTLVAGAESVTGRRTLQDTTWAFTPRQPRILYLSIEKGALRSLWEVPPEGGEPRALFAPEYGIDSFSPSPDGAQIAVAVQTATPTVDIWLIDAGGSNARKVVDCAPDACGNVAWSPDGRVIAYELRDKGALPGRIWLYDVANGTTAPVFQDRQVLGHTPAWSPDARRIAFYDASVESIRVLDMDTGAVALIPTLMGEGGDFSPDGERMVYADIRRVGRQFVPELWLAELAPGGGLAPLLDDAQDDQGGAWSPDGRLIAFGRHNLADGPSSWTAGRQLVLYDRETGELRQITNDLSYNNTTFKWDPTGGRLLVQRFRLAEQFASPEIWVYDLASGVLRQVSENGILGRWLP